MRLLLGRNANQRFESLTNRFVMLARRAYIKGNTTDVYGNHDLTANEKKVLARIQKLARERPVELDREFAHFLNLFEGNKTSSQLLTGKMEGGSTWWTLYSFRDFKDSLRKAAKLDAEHEEKLNELFESTRAHMRYLEFEVYRLVCDLVEGKYAASPEGRDEFAKLQARVVELQGELEAYYRTADVREGEIRDLQSVLLKRRFEIKDLENRIEDEQTLSYILYLDKKELEKRLQASEDHQAGLERVIATERSLVASLGASLEDKREQLGLAGAHLSFLHRAAEALDDLRLQGTATVRADLLEAQSEALQAQASLKALGNRHAYELAQVNLAANERSEIARTAALDKLEEERASNRAHLEVALAAERQAVRFQFAAILEALGAMEAVKGSELSALDWRGVRERARASAQRENLLTDAEKKAFQFGKLKESNSRLAELLASRERELRSSREQLAQLESLSPTNADAYLQALERDLDPDASKAELELENESLRAENAALRQALTKAKEEWDSCAESVIELRERVKPRLEASLWEESCNESEKESDPNLRIAKPYE